MKTIKYILLLAVSMFITSAFAQNSINGKIYDKVTKEPLVGVSIFIPNTQTATATDNNGAFTLTSIERFDSVDVRYMGYQTQRVKVEQGKNLNVALTPSAYNMQEVVITASRDTQSRADVPMAISKLTATTINDAKATQMVELVNKVPGVAMVNLGNEQHEMSIRQPMGTNAYFLYMEDGVPLHPMGVFNHNEILEMNQFAVNNIEVVKGPASSLYGPEAVGGAINFITKKATAVPTAAVGIQCDNHGYKRVQYGTGAMIGKKLGFYVGGFYSEQKNGWMSYSDYTKNSVNARFDYELTKKTKLTLAGSYNDYYSDMASSIDSAHYYSKQLTSNNTFGYRQVKALRTRLAINHEWNKNNHTMLTLFYRNNNTAQNPSYYISWTPHSTTATGQINDNVFQSRGLILQHIADIKALRTKLTVGTYLDNSPNTYAAHQINLAAQLNPGGTSVQQFTIAQDMPTIKLGDYNANIVNSAAYAQAEIKPIDKLIITLGGRYDNMYFTYNNNLNSTSGSKMLAKFTPKIGATYKFTKNAGAYANYSQGFSPVPLTTMFTVIPNTNPPSFYTNLQPAQFTNYEMGGWVSLIKNKLDMDVALYQMLGTNELLSIKQPNNTYLYQTAGKTTHEGVEYGVTYRPNSQWMARFGGTNAIHRYDTFVLSTKPTDAVQNVNGKIMANAPNWIANSEVIYKPKYIKGFRIGVEWQRMSSYYENQTNTLKYTDKGAFGLQGVSVLNFRTGYQWKGIEVFMNIMNFTNEYYAAIVTAGNAANASATATYNPAPPRTFVFGVQYNFTGKK